MVWHTQIVAKLYPGYGLAYEILANPYPGYTLATIDVCKNVPLVQSGYD